MSDERTSGVTGQCLGGAVRFKLDGPLDGVSNCHCGQCRRWHGHVGAYANVRRTAVMFTDDSRLKLTHHPISRGADFAAIADRCCSGMPARATRFR